jgi:excisionase family DNA binding protein
MSDKPISLVIPDVRQYYSLKECAAITGLSRRTLTRAIHAGNLRAHRVGRSILIFKVDLVAWVERSPVGRSRA